MMILLMMMVVRMMMIVAMMFFIYDVGDVDYDDGDNDSIRTYL